AYLQLFRAKRIDGLILSGPRFQDDALRVLEELVFPTVLMGNLPNSNFCSVDVDNVSAAYKAVKHLIGLGHRRIACITNADLSYTSAADRLQGYRQSLQDAGLPYDESISRFGDFDPDSGYAQMEHLLEKVFFKEPFTAAFIASDVVALGAKAAIRDKGLCIPRDIALVGFDDVPFSRYTDPPLTTIRLPSHDLGWNAGDRLIRMINGENIEDKHIL